MRPHRFFFLLCLVMAGWASAEAPANDDRATATQIVNGEIFRGTLAGSTLEESEPMFSEKVVRTVWYRWVAEEGGRREVRVLSDQGGMSSAVYQETAGGELEILAYSGFIKKADPEGDPVGEYPQSTGARFQARAGEVFWIQVYELVRRGDLFEIKVEPLLLREPRGDRFEDAVELAGGREFYQIDFFGAMLEEGEPATSHRGSVWRKWRAPSAGYWRFRHDAFLVDSVELWQGEGLSTLEQVEVAETAFQGLVVLSAEEGEEFWIRVAGSYDRIFDLKIDAAAEGDFFDSPVNYGRVETFRHVRDLLDLVTNEVGEPVSFHAGSQWLLWEAPHAGQYEIRVGLEGVATPNSSRSPITVVNLFLGNEINQLTEIPSHLVGYENEILRFFVSKGDRVRLQTAFYYPPIPYGSNVYDGQGSSPPKEMIVEMRALPAAPPNDDLSQADDLGRVLAGQVEGTNAGATVEEDVETLEARDSVWTRWECPKTGEFEMLLESDFQLRLGVLRGSSLEGFEEIAEGRTGGIVVSNEMRLRFQGEEGRIYHFKVTGGSKGDQGGYQLFLRELAPPGNDDRENALVLTGEIPLTFSGDTRGGRLEVPLEESSASYAAYLERSTVWWEWSAPESGIFELRGDGLLSVFANTGGSWNLGRQESLLFEARQGVKYHLRLGHHWSEEREISLTLDRAVGLDYSSAEKAFDAGGALGFSTPEIEVRSGEVQLRNTVASGAAWYRWTPQSSGWVVVDSAGSGGVIDLSGYWLRSFSRQLVSTTLDAGSVVQAEAFSRQRLPRRETEKGFFRNQKLRIPSLVPTRTKMVMEVTAGETYYLEAVPREGSGLVTVQLEVRPIGPPPELIFEGLSVSLSDDGGWLEVEMIIEALNGFGAGTVSIGSKMAGFGNPERIWGDARRGIYRVLIPWHHRSEPFSTIARMKLIDQVGRKVELNQELIVPATPDFESTLFDEIGPEFVGLTRRFREVLVGVESQIIELEFAIRDDGGSGLVKGEILLPGEWDDFGEESRWRIPFGPAQRIKGDSRLGIYRVEVEIPPWTPAGMLRCQLRDRAGNLGGVWDEIHNLSFYDTGRLNRFIPMSVNLVRTNTEEASDAVISGMAANSSDGALVASATVSHPVGVYGGQVILLDDQGLIVGSAAFSDQDRVSGDHRDGVYEVTISNKIPTEGESFRVLWIVMGADGRKVEVLMDDAVTLQGSDSVDTRRPTLLTFEIFREVVDLSGGTAEVEVALTAEDDKAGLVAEVIVLTNDGRELGRGVSSSNESFLDSQIVIPLTKIDRSTRGWLVVLLTDESGRQEIYGEMQSREWAGQGVILGLGGEELSEFERWTEQWLPAGAEDDPDRDGWPNLLEFALGTDPLVPAVRDPLGSSLPRFTRENEVVTALGYQQQMTTQLRPAPWFQLVDGELIGGGFKLTVEGSSDLKSWSEIGTAEELLDGVGFVEFSEGFDSSERLRVQRLRVRE